MIKQIELNNFQSHKKLKLDLKDLTFIVGESDVGKSSILRSFYWLTGVQSTGATRLITRGEKSGSVSILLNGDISIKKKTTGTEKGIEYEISKPQEKNLKLERVGTSIPEEVKSLLNITDINIQQQFEPHFLLSKTPTEIYNVLNDHFDLSVWDKLKAKVTSEANSRKTVCKLKEKDLNEIKDYLTVNQTKYNRLNEILTIHNDMTSQLEKKKYNLSTINNIFIKVKNNQLKLDKIQEVVTKYQHLLVVHSLKRLSKIIDSDVKVSYMIQRIESSIKSIYLTKLKSVLSVELKNEEAVKKTFIYSIKRLGIMNTYMLRLHGISKNLLGVYLKLNYLRIAELSDSINGMQKEIDMLQTMSVGIQICPTCQRPLS